MKKLMNKFIQLFFTSSFYDHLIQSLKEDNEALVDRLSEAYRLYCVECKRGFNKYVGKAAHDRLLHSPNPTILRRKTVSE